MTKKQMAKEIAAIERDIDDDYRDRLNMILEYEIGDSPYTASAVERLSYRRALDLHSDVTDLYTGAKAAS